MLRSAFLLLVAILVSSCAAHVSGLQHDQSFNYKSVQTGGIAVGGVASIGVDASPSELKYYAELYRREIVEERREFQVAAAGDVAYALGDSYPAMMASFSADGVLNAQQLEQLRQAPLTAEYVIFSRIEDHNIEENRSESPVFDKDGKEVKNRINVSLNTVASITAFSRIYDRLTGKSVWSGSVTQNKTNENSFESYNGSSFKKALSDAILGDIGNTREQPPAPKFTEVLSEVFRGFAENLPKKN